MKVVNKTLFFLFLIIGVFYKAEEVPAPPAPPGGGGGGVGPGQVASPIDMYVYILVIAAIFFIALYAKKFKNNQAV